jgi:hypothetical protein
VKVVYLFFIDGIANANPEECIVTVGQMAKDKKWDGVRLLSFDLQTVEFAYSEVGYIIPTAIPFSRSLKGHARTIQYQ